MAKYYAGSRDHLSSSSKGQAEKIQSEKDHSKWHRYEPSFESTHWKWQERNNFFQDHGVCILKVDSFQDLWLPKVNSFQDPCWKSQKINSQIYCPCKWGESSHFRSSDGKSAQAVKEQPLKGPPPKGSRFNPIYVEPGSTSINSTRDLQALFPNSFDYIGDMSGEYNIKTDPTVLPVQHRRHKVPTEYKDEIENQLGEMVWQGTIMKQTEPTPWVISLIYPKKANDKLRICLGPKDPNKAIIQENLKAAILEEIAHIPMGATKFSKVHS